MKRICLLVLMVLLLFFGISLHFSVQHSYAQTPTPTMDPNIADGDWLPDADVTFQGKTASRSALLLNLVLKNYQWATIGGEQSLIIFWTNIRNVVYAILLLVLLAAAFAIIISGGKSLTAWTFARRFIIMVILIWFSFALTRFLYEVIDIIIGFFNRNPQGVIITSKDLFNMSFNYQGFIGLRRFGPSYDESAFVSLLLVRLTAITYYVMSGILLVRKIILWFFIAVSPIYPLLLFHFPIRNTAKIWIGEFFRWLLYAPLFFIFLSSLVVVWQHNIDIFPFQYIQNQIVYPTAINILLGGPGQQLTVDNSVNYNDTFAEYVIALIMLWIVIFLPFILLRIFLDYLWSLNLDKDNTLGYLQNVVKRVPGSQYIFPNSPLPPGKYPPGPPPGTHPTGMAKPILYGTTGLARELPTAAALSEHKSTVKEIAKPTQTHTSVVNNVYNNVTTQTPAFKSEKTSVETAKLVNFPIPRMRDIAHLETNRSSSQITKQQQISRMHETLEKIANPQSITNTVERQQFTQLRDKLLQQSQKGEPLATSILKAANTVTNQSTKSVITQSTHETVTQIQQMIQKINNPEIVTDNSQRQQFTVLKNKLAQASKQGDQYATTVMNMKSESQVQQTIQKLSAPQTITNAVEREQFTKLKAQLIEKSKQGDTVATSLLAASETVAKANESTLPQANQVQTVNLEDYEEVKKTWLENYKKMEIPNTAENKTRKDWIQKDLQKMTETIDLLNSQDQQKVSQGMQEVSQLLPFLLIGGFSQTEVVAYLQAKKHAAEEALTQIKDSDNEEDTMVDATKREAHATKHMQASVVNTADFSSNSDDESDENPLSNILQGYSQRIQTIKKEAPKLKSEQTSQKTLKLLNFSIPTISDIARYESAPITAQQNVQQEMTQVNEMLKNLAFPESIPQEDQKQQFILMKQQLVESAQKGDPLANAILFSVNTISQTNIMAQSNQQYTQAMNSLLQTIQKFINPKISAQDAEEKQFMQMKQTITNEAAQGNPYAAFVINIADKVSQTTPENQGQVSNTVQELLLNISNPMNNTNTDQQQYYTQIKQELEKRNAAGDPVANAIMLVLPHIIPTKSVLPQTNDVQTVNLDDYEAVRSMWHDIYKSSEVPAISANPKPTRQEWIREDMKHLSETMAMLKSEDSEKIALGMQQVGSLLPFLLIGGFSQSEIVAYLQAKQQAGADVLQELSEKEAEEDSQVTLTAKKNETVLSQAQSEQLPEQESEKHEN